jgi:tetratricopeptide (TPR) repeat protein
MVLAAECIDRARKGSFIRHKLATTICNNGRAMPRSIHRLLMLAVLSLTCSWFAAAQDKPSTAPQASQSKADEAKDLLKQGEALVRDGKPDDAVALYQRAADLDPDLYQAQLFLGVALDLQGSYDDARKHLARAIELAPAEQAVQPLRVMAVSYAFQCNTDKAAEYERRAFDLQYKWNKFSDAAGTADELARIYLECGDYDNAFQWYQTGHLTALKTPDLKPAEKDLWEFRWEAALARLAARKGQGDKARQHLAAAKAILDKNDNPDQARFYPYLAGYVALWTGDYKGAIADLQNADQKDVFVLSLLAQAYEKSGEKAEAIDYYKKVLTVNAHNPTNAFARPLAKKKLAELGQ